MQSVQFTMLALDARQKPVDDEFPVQCAMNELLPEAIIVENLGDGNWMIDLPYAEAMRISESAAVEGYHWHATTTLGGNLIGLVI